MATQSLAPKPLTPQEEEFAQLIVSGMTQSDAFIAIRPHAAQWKDNSVYSRSSMLAAKVRRRIEALRGDLADNNALSHDKTIAEYKDAGFAKIAEQPTYADKHTALKGIRAMMGYDAPTKTEETNKSLNLAVQVELRTFTIEELRLMLVAARELERGG